jgi:hypothetical protein
MRHMILILVATAALAVAGAKAVAEPVCAPGDVAAAQLKSPLIKSGDDAIQLSKSYFSLATDQRDMFDKRKYAFDVVRSGEVWTATIIFMRRPRYPWDDWKRRGRVGKVTLCGFDGRLLGIEATY